MGLAGAHDLDAGRVEGAGVEQILLPVFAGVLLQLVGDRVDSIVKTAGRDWSLA